MHIATITKLNPVKKRNDQLHLVDGFVDGQGEKDRVDGKVFQDLDGVAPLKVLQLRGKGPTPTDGQGAQGVPVIVIRLIGL